MKVLEDMTSKHKYLEKGEALGSRNRTRTSTECPKNNNLELSSRHQVNDVVCFEGKGPELRLGTQRITLFS